MTYQPQQRTPSRVVSARQVTFDRIGMFLVVGAGLCALSYFLIVGATVYTVSERNGLRTALQTAQAQLAEREADYFKQSNTLLASGLQSYGYSQDTKPSFVYEGKIGTDQILVAER